MKSVLIGARKTSTAGRNEARWHGRAFIVVHTPIVDIVVSYVPAGRAAIDPIAVLRDWSSTPCPTNHGLSATSERFGPARPAGPVAFPNEHVRHSFWKTTGVDLWRNAMFNRARWH
jgi:hypothetical protein